MVALLERLYRKRNIAKATELCLQDHIEPKPFYNCREKLTEGMAAMAARAIWKGSISFGLVNIPIQVFFCRNI